MWTSQKSVWQNLLFCMAKPPIYPPYLYGKTSYLYGKTSYLQSCKPNTYGHYKHPTNTYENILYEILMKGITLVDNYKK